MRWGEVGRPRFQVAVCAPVRIRKLFQNCFMDLHTKLTLIPLDDQSTAKSLSQANQASCHLLKLEILLEFQI